MSDDTMTLRFIVEVEAKDYGDWRGFEKFSKNVTTSITRALGMCGYVRVEVREEADSE